jgi:hypothetical protein
MNILTPCWLTGLNRAWRLLMLLALLAGCQGAADDAPLPTLVDLDTMATESAATAFAIASPTFTPLPSTWTPSPLPTETPTDPALLPTPTPEGFRTLGTLYYIFNNDAIVELAADGSFEDLLPIPHIGQGVSDLAAAPDGQRLAYVAPAGENIREIYLTNRKGTNTAQLSRLGYARVFNLIWQPDGGALAFLAAQTADAPLAIYLINADGTGQRAAGPVVSDRLRDLVWNAAGDRLLYSDEAIYALNPVTGVVSPPLTAATGFGPDYGLAHSPSAPRLHYLKSQRDLDTGRSGGVPAIIDTISVDTPANELRGARVFYDLLRFSPDGAYLLLVDGGTVTVQSLALGSSSTILRDVQTAPQPVFSPDTELIAYVDLDASGVQQIFTIPRAGGAPTQITFHQDGTISALNWVAG